MLSYDEFEAFFRKNGYCYGAFSRTAQNWNDRELRSRYEKYLRKEEKAKQKRKVDREKPDPIPTPDGEKICALTEILQLDEFHDLQRAAGPLLHILDRAHIFGKGPYPHMKADPDNIVWLNRYSHNNLDQSRDPISGLQISAEKVEQWWILIVGEQRYNRLQLKSRRRK